MKRVADGILGFEGLTVSADGKSLYVLLQAATVQEGVRLHPIAPVGTR